MTLRYDEENCDWHDPMDDIYDEYWEPEWEPEPDLDPLEGIMMLDDGPFFCRLDPDVERKMLVWRGWNENQEDR